MGLLGSVWKAIWNGCGGGLVVAVKKMYVDNSKGFKDSIYEKVSIFA